MNLQELTQRLHRIRHQLGSAQWLQHKPNL